MMRASPIAVFVLLFASLSNAQHKAGERYKQIRIEAADCSYLDDWSGAMLCEAEANVRLKSGKEEKLYLVCNGKWATCMKLTYGQTYAFEVLDSAKYQDCGNQTKLTACIKIHARPYDLIYILSRSK